jgi:hypothetical protein
MLNLCPLRLMYNCRHDHHEVSSGTRDSRNFGSYMVNLFHYCPNYSAHHTQEATGADTSPCTPIFDPDDSDPIPGLMASTSSRVQMTEQFTCRISSQERHGCCTSATNPTPDTMKYCAPVQSGPALRSTHYSKSARGHDQDVDSTDTPLIAYSNAYPCGPPSDSSSSLVDHGGSATVSDNVLWKFCLNVSAQVRPANDMGSRYSCPFSGCDVVYEHPRRMNRHLLAHLPSWLSCPIPGCAWRGDRWRHLRKHRRDKHPSSSHEVDRNESMIYDPEPLMQIIEDENTLQNATRQAISLVKIRALEVQKLELWDGNFWGRKKRRGEGHGSSPDDDEDLIQEEAGDRQHIGLKFVQSIRDKMPDVASDQHINQSPSTSGVNH